MASENNEIKFPPVPVTTAQVEQSSMELPDEFKVVSSAGGKEYVVRTKTDNPGVFGLVPTKNGTEVEVFLCSLLLVVALFRDIKNTGWGRLLKFSDLDGHNHEYVLNAASVSKDESILISALRHEGLSINTHKIHHYRLIDYILNTPPITDRKIRSTNKTGWHSRNVFVTQQRCFGITDEEIIYDGKLAHHSYAESGTTEQWRENIGRYCVCNPILTFCTSMAFAAPLLYLLDIENGGFNLMGESSIGKSTAMKVATSVFGRPEKGYAMQQWNATVNAMEAIANSYNDGMLPLDEIGQASGNDIGNTIYMVGNGMGKGRMSSNAELRNRQTFRCLFLSSGEKTLEAHMGESGKSVRAGQEVRLVDIVADMGEGYGIYNDIHDQMNSHDFNEMLLDNSLQYYGSPMVAYLDKLVGIPEKAVGRMAEMIDRFIGEVSPDNADGQVKRIAGRFALVACGGELATSLGITGWDAGTAYNDAKILFNRWLDERGNSGKSEDQKLIAKVRRFFELHGESRFARLDSSTDSRTVANRAGFVAVSIVETVNPVIGVKKLVNQNVFYVMSEGFKEICEGFSHKWASKVLLAHGILKPNKDGTAMHSRRLPGFATPKKVYIFTSNVIEDFKGSEAAGKHVSGEGTTGTQVHTA